jgi:hypothetical protein
MKKLTLTLQICLMLLVSLTAFANDRNRRSMGENPVDIALDQKLTPAERSTERSSKISELKTNLEKLYEYYVDGENKLGPSHQKEELTMMLDDLYAMSFISLSQRNNFITGYLGVNRVDESIGCMSSKCRWKKGYQNYINAAITALRNTSAPPCVAVGQVSTTGYCCGQTLSLPNYVYTKNNNSCGKKAREACTSHGECCSKFCSGIESDGGGVCTSVKTCYALVPLGSECDIDNPYCRDGRCVNINYNSSNVSECTVNRNGAACSTNLDCCSDKCEDNKCVPKRMCLDCYERGETPPEGKSCCPGLLKGIDGHCIPDFPPFILPRSSDNDTITIEDILKKITYNIIQNIFPSAHAAVDCSGTSCTVTEGDKSLTNEQEQDLEQQIKICMEKSDEEEKKTCLENVNEWRKSMIAGNQEDQDPVEISQEEFVSIFNIPAFTSRERSDVHKCEFNSWKDNWLDASRTQKNAEIVLRGFETVLSGVGTRDRVFFSGDNKDKNVYMRLREIMEDLRKNRIEMAMELAELDKDLACDCMEVFGVNTFDADKQTAYTDHCGAAEETQEGVEGDEAQIADTDQGATGLSHEKLLVSWLYMRAQIQMSRFDKNAGMEGKLEELISDLNEIVWEDGDMTEREYLYSFRVKWTRGWIAWAVGIILAIVAIVFVIATFGGGLVILGAALAGGAALAAGYYGTNLVIGLIDGPEGTADWHDEKSGGEDCGVFTCKQRYKRYLYWPKYSDATVNGTTHALKCNVRGFKKNCIRNFYASTIDEPLRTDEDYLAFFANYGESPLIDIWVPVFYPVDDEWFMEEMGMVQKFNDGYQSGRDAMYAARPTGDKKKAYLDENPIEPHLDAFKPDFSTFTKSNGETFKDKYVFNQAKIDKLKESIVTYARCDKLKDCGTMNADTTGTVEINGEQVDLLGLKNFFETDEDAQMFADYVYQMHFFWPRLSADDDKTYPLMGLSAYLEALLYNLKLLGSLNGMRSMAYADAFNAYNEDFNKRKGFYPDAVGGTKMGESGYNPKYSKAVFEAFQLVDFNSGAGIEGFNKAMEEAAASGTLTAADMELADTVKNHALNMKKDEKEYNHYQKHYANTPRGKRKVSAAKTFMEKFNDPLSMIPNLDKGHGVNPMSGKVEEAKAKQNNGSTKQSTPDLSLNMPSFDMPNYNQPSFNSSSSMPKVSGKTKGPSHGLTGEQVRSMIDQGKKNKDNSTIDPNDSIFRIVSKAYKRNLDRVLVSAESLQKSKKGITIQLEKDKKKDISDKTKNELKGLLDD